MNEKTNTYTVRYSNLSDDYVAKNKSAPCMHGISIDEPCYRCEKLSVKWKDKDSKIKHIQKDNRV